MLRKTALALSLASVVLLPGCLAGPHQLRRSVDDFDRKLYVESPWVDGLLWVVPVFPVATYLAWFADSVTTDAYAFWFKDAWDGEGTGFEHYSVDATDGSMRSLLIDDAKFLKIEP